MLITTIIILFLCYVLAGMFDAAKDTVAQHPQNSIFPQTIYFNAGFESWKLKYINNDITKGYKKWGPINKPVVFTDFWHLCKLLEIIFLLLPLSILIYFKFPISGFMDAIICGLIAGTVRNLSFDLFYNVIFKR